MELLVDLYLQGQIHQTQVAAQHAKDATKQARLELDQLNRKVNALTITCQALWEILRAERGLTDPMILQKMREIDVRDGKADGRISPRAVPCPYCTRLNNTAQKTCVYCGKKLPTENVFEKF